MAKLFIEETTLTAIGDAIRGKEGTTELVPVNDMAIRISNLPSGGGGGDDIEPIVLTGNCQYACSGALATACMEMFPDKISTKDITVGSSMFQGNTAITSVPFDLNFADNAALEGIFRDCSALTHIPDITVNVPNTNGVSVSHAFNGCTNLQVVPYIYNVRPATLASLFYSCRNLREIPDDYFSTWDNGRVISYSYGGGSGVYSTCFSLRKIPSSFFQFYCDGIGTSGSYVIYDNLANSCYCLDEIIDLPVHSGVLTANRMSNTIKNCSRLKNLTFQTNDDGTPKTANWKSQIIDFTATTGWTADLTSITRYNSGITADKQVTDDATYQQLKNDPDWFTKDANYSRYDHDSAVRTINSLPDTTSSGGTNTIKFKGTAGSATDGGAINTLTEEEIAVATAKGWTVTIS